MNNKSNGGAEITKINALHTAIVDACLTSIEQQLADGNQVSPQLINAAQKICSEAGVNPTREQSDQLDRLLSLMPTIDMSSITRMR